MPDTNNPKVIFANIAESLPSRFFIAEFHRVSKRTNVASRITLTDVKFHEHCLDIILRYSLHGCNFAPGHLSCNAEVAITASGNLIILRWL